MYHQAHLPKWVSIPLRMGHNQENMVAPRAKGRKRTWKFLVVFAAATLPAQQTSRIPAEIAGDSYDLYSAILKDATAIAVDVAPEWEHLMLARCFDPKSDEDREMTGSARELAKKKYVWESRFKLGREYRLLTKEDIERAFCQPRENGPCVPVMGGAETVYYLSAPGFNKDHTRALIWMNAVCGGLCGGGKVAVYRKGNEGWRRDDDPFARCAWNR